MAATCCFTRSPAFTLTGHHPPIQNSEPLLHACIFLSNLWCSLLRLDLRTERNENENQKIGAQLNIEYSFTFYFLLLLVESQSHQIHQPSLASCFHHNNKSIGSQRQLSVSETWLQFPKKGKKKVPKAVAGAFRLPKALTKTIVTYPCRSPPGHNLEPAASYDSWSCSHLIQPISTPIALMALTKHTASTYIA